MKKIIILFVMISISINIFAADLETFIKTQKFVAPELIKDSFDRDFYLTDPPASPARSIAEFEPMEAVIVRHPFGIPMELVVELSQLVQVITLHTGSYSSIQTQYENAGVNMDNCTFQNVATDSYWTRDFSPWFIFDGENNFGLVNFIYNRPRPNDNDFPIEYGNANGVSVYGMPLEQTGGNYMADGMGKAVSTEIAFDENPSLTEAEVRQHMEDYLGITDYEVINDPQGDYIKHVDCWGKYLDVDKILLAQVPENNPRYDEYEAVADYFENKISSYGTPYQVFRVQSLSNDYQPTPFTNSLILNDHVFVPVTGTSVDDAAIQVYQDAMPGYTIVPILNDDYSIGWMNTDALHCRTHEVPDDEMIYIYHIPVIIDDERQSINIDAMIYPHSGESLVTDQVYVSYKVNDGDYQNVAMTITDNDNYSATINDLTSGDVVSYFIHAEDNAGKVANHPYIGAADPHVFTVLGDDNLAPEIQHVPITEVEINDLPLTFLAEVSDDHSVSFVKLAYKINNGDVIEENFIVNAEYEVAWSLNWNADVDVNDTVDYKIIAQDTSGNESTFPTTGFQSFTVNSTSNDVNHTQSLLLRSHPNPFNPSTTISYFLTNQQKVNLTIYNAKGQKVKTLVNDVQRKGLHKLNWNGTTSGGTPISSGVYFVRLSGKGFVKTHKIMLMK